MGQTLVLTFIWTQFTLYEHKLCTNSGVRNQTSHSHAAYYAAEKNPRTPQYVTVLLIGIAKAVLALYYAI